MALVDSTLRMCVHWIPGMRKRLIFAGLALAILRFPENVYAQFTDPRMYDNTAVGVSQLELAYAYARSNSSIDTSLIVTGAQFNLNQGLVGYTRDFRFVHQLAWVNANVPLADLAGSVSSIGLHGATSGAGDSSYQLATLLKGGPALSVAQMANYKPVTTLGASLTFTAPTGQYSAFKVLNLGSNRWSFKPEIALSHPFGPGQKWEFDAYANTYFYTDNNAYHGAQTLRQHALPGIEGHISYSFSSRLWASLDTRYAFGGDTFVNGVNQNNPQQNFILGDEVNLTLNSRNSLVFVVGKALVHQNGPTAGGFAVRYFYSWGKGYK
jgi:Putative MetA-pathway of phenol degradation